MIFWKTVLSSLVCSIIFTFMFYLVLITLLIVGLDGIQLSFIITPVLSLLLSLLFIWKYLGDQPILIVPISVTLTVALVFLGTYIWNEYFYIPNELIPNIFMGMLRISVMIQMLLGYFFFFYIRVIKKQKGVKKQ